MEENKKIILAGTNLFFSEKLSAQLRRGGYSVLSESSFEGIRNHLASGISAVVLDLASRGMDAVDLIRKLKASPETAKIPLVGFCGHKDGDLIESARSAGCDLVTTNGTVSSDLPGLLREIGGAS